MLVRSRTGPSVPGRPARRGTVVAAHADVRLRSRTPGALAATGAGDGRLPAVHAGLRRADAEGHARCLRDLRGQARRARGAGAPDPVGARRSEEHTSELQSLMRISYAVFCLKNTKHTNQTHTQVSRTS